MSAVSIEANDSESIFVLTQALLAFADDQRDKAEADPPSRESRQQWAQIADDLREQIDEQINQG